LRHLDHIYYDPVVVAIDASGFDWSFMPLPTIDSDANSAKNIQPTHFVPVLAGSQ
jgi:hypothetical protein